MILNYINYNTLITDTLKLSKRIPRKYDLVVGIPKSGMIPARIISQILDANLESVEPFRMKQRWFDDREYIKRVLLVDDSITSGNTIKKVKEYLKDSDVIFDTAVIYTDRPDMKVTYFERRIDAPRIFQWNLFKHGHLKHACIDFDGVLCKDPIIIEDDNNPEIMIDHILNAEPLHIPKKPVFAIITNRIEKFRPQTIEWLEKYNVKYEKLIMYPGTANERRNHFTSLGGNGYWKAEKFNELFTGWFIESNITQAKQIRSKINASVYCTDTMQMI